MSHLLEIEGLSVSFRTPYGLVRAVNEACVTLEKGETLVIVGESGSGKTVLAHAILRLLPRNVEVSGSVRLNGVDLLQLSEGRMRPYRGRSMALIPQSPSAALNPVRRLGPLLLEMARARGLSGDEAGAALRKVLDEIGLEFGRLESMYAHQLSGGMQQRVVNALALVGRPDVVIADEPTFGLDADLVDVTAGQLRRVAESGAALMVITHDLALAERLGGRLALLYAGRIVELRQTAAFFAGPSHPYGVGLLGARPESGGHPIPGLAPELTALPPFCAFAPRCARRFEPCTTRVPDEYPLPDATGTARCFLHVASGADQPPVPAQDGMADGPGRDLTESGAGRAPGAGGPERLR